MRKILFVLLFIALPVCAEVKFNALDRTDPDYLEFHSAVCSYTLSYVKRMDDKIQELSAKISSATVETEKKGLIENFRVASALKQGWSSDYMTYCRP